jgi:hypothetical protein
MNKILGLAGQIKSFRGPDLARGPYVVHAWSKMFSDLSKKDFQTLLRQKRKENVSDICEYLFLREIKREERYFFVIPLNPKELHFLKIYANLFNLIQMILLFGLILFRSTDIFFVQILNHFFRKFY